MNDFVQVVFWLFVLAGGAVFCVTARRAGLKVTYVRDILHVCTGVWVFGWKFWENPLFPSVITIFAFAVIFIMPYVKISIFEKFMESVSDADETWTGIVFYLFSYMVFTQAGLYSGKFPAAAALLCLSFGDGAGGLAGKLIGRRFYTLQWTKRKSLEGSSVVFASSLFSIIISGIYFEVELSMAAAVSAALIASLAEALSPRRLDNLIVPVSVYVLMTISHH